MKVGDLVRHVNDGWFAEVIDKTEHTVVVNAQDTNVHSGEYSVAMFEVVEDDDE